jgi:CBS domain containing-hemolysin-like protein
MPDANRWFRRGFGNAILTLILSLIFSFLAEALLRRVQILIIAFLFLMLVILAGAIADMVGFAAVASEIGPLNARAANKVWGARQAVRLVKNADQVAIFCSDVLGDISSTLAGALGALIVFRILSGQPKLESGMITIMTAIVAALCVGCKAIGKGIALRDANEIIFHLGQVTAWVEKITGYEFFRPSRGDRVKKK